MTQRNWLGNTGAWSDPTQWDTGLPGTADTANFGPGGTYEVQFATSATLISVGEGSSTGTLAITSGVLDLTGNGGNSTWDGVITQSGGTVVVQSGTLKIDGTVTQTGGEIALGLGAHLQQPAGVASFAGEITGLGELDVGGDVTLDGGILTVAAISMGSTGTIDIGANTDYTGAYIRTGGFVNSGTLMPDGHQLTLFGGDTLVKRPINFGSTRIGGPGTVAVDGSADLSSLALVGVGATLFDAGTMTMDGNFALGPGSTDRASLTIDPGAVFDIVTDTQLSSSNAGTAATGSILNDGLFEKTAGVASGVITKEQAAITSNGTLRVDVGDLDLQGVGNVLAGTVDGAGTLSVSSGGTATLAAGVVFDPLTTLAVGFGGVLALGASLSPASDVILTRNGTIALQGNTLLVQGLGALDGTVQGEGGTLLIGGVYDLNAFTETGGTLTVHAQGLVTQSGFVNLGAGPGDKVGFQIDTGAVYDIVASQGVSGGNHIYSFNNGTTVDGLILNDGLFEMTSDGGGAVHVDTLFANNSGPGGIGGGTILIARGTVDWTQGLVNDGVGTIEGTAIIGGIPTAGGQQASTGGHAGTLTIAAGGTINVSGPVNAASTIAFAGPGEIIVNTTSVFAGTVTGFGPGDTIDFLNTRANEHIVGGADSLTLINVTNGTSTTLGTFQMLLPGGATFTGDGNGGTKIVASDPGSFALVPSTIPVPIDGWIAPGTGAGDWFTAADWNAGVPGDVDVQLGTGGGTITFNGAATVNSLTASAPLLMAGGRLKVNNGGIWIGFVTQNAGAIESVTGFEISSAAYNQSLGAVLQSDSGTLEVLGTFQAAGTITGASTVDIAGTLTPVPGGLIDVGVLRIGGTFVPYAGETITDNLVLVSAVMPLFGSTLTIAGQAQLDATVAASTHPNAIIVTGTADTGGLIMQGTGDLLQIQGAAMQTGGLLIMSASGAQLNVQPNATYDLRSDTGINIFNGNVVSAGLFEKTGGNGLSELQEPFTSTGTVMVNVGTLWLNSPTVDLAGTVSGQGTLKTTNGGNAVVTLEAGLFVNVSTFAAGGVVLAADQSYGGVFSSDGNLMLQGHTLTLFDTAELSGSVTGPGVLSVTHSADLNAGLNSVVISGAGVTLSDTGVLTQSSAISLGGTSTDHVTLSIAPGHIYNVLTDNIIIGGVFGGTVTGTIANAGTFEKTGGGSVGTQIFAELDNTGTVLVQQGTLRLSAAAINDGSIIVNGNLTVDANAGISADSGQSGTIEIVGAATLIANGPIAADQTIVYDPGGMIQIPQIASFAGVIGNFTQGDTIDLVNTVANGDSYANGTLTLTQTFGTNTATVGTLAMPGLGNPNFLLANDAAGGTFIIEAPCFAAGTRIDTPHGPIAVERLRVGDVVMTARGEPIEAQWLGHRRVDCRRQQRPADVQPVRIAAGAFGPNQPRRALRLSPDHAVYVDGFLVPVRYLINGVTIAQEDVDAINYWHVELPRHDVLLAEGLPAESYLDTGNRHAFDDAGIAVRRSAV